jgi:hypothetical protein
LPDSQLHPLGQGQLSPQSQAAPQQQSRSMRALVFAALAQPQAAVVWGAQQLAFLRFS